MDKHAFKLGIALTIFTIFILVWLIGAVGIIGKAGERIDVLYFSIPAIFLLSSVICKFKAASLKWILVLMALFQLSIAIVALGLDKHQAPYSSIFEILGLNSFFAFLFLVSAWLFGQASIVKEGA